LLQVIVDIANLVRGLNI